jgi:hypothetical protein
LVKPKEIVTLERGFFYIFPVIPDSIRNLFYFWIPAFPPEVDRRGNEEKEDRFKLL